MRGLDHPGIVRYHEHFVHEEQLCVVMHYCEGGDLSQHIKRRAKHEQPFAEHEAIDLFVQIVMVSALARSPAALSRPPPSPSPPLAPPPLPAAPTTPVDARGARALDTRFS